MQGKATEMVKEHADLSVAQTKSVKGSSGTATGGRACASEEEGRNIKTAVRRPNIQPPTASLRLKFTPYIYMRAQYARVRARPRARACARHPITPRTRVKSGTAMTMSRDTIAWCRSVRRVKGSAVSRCQWRLTVRRN